MLSRFAPKKKLHPRGITPVDRAALEAVREDVEKLKANAEIAWEYAAARAIGREIEAMYQEALGRYMEVKAATDRADLLRGKNGLTFSIFMTKCGNFTVIIP
jgi:hypothetical protein